MSTLEAPVKMKSFWERREGKIGKWISAGLLGAAGLVVWYKILPFLLTIVWGTTQLIIGGVILTLLIMMITNKRFQTLARVLVQMASQLLTYGTIALAPEAILDLYLRDRKQKHSKGTELTEKLRGVLNLFDSKIEKNKREIRAEHDRAAAAKKKLERGNLSDVERRRTVMAFKQCLSHAGMMGDTNQKLAVYREQIKRAYNIMLRIGDAAEFVITYTAQQIEQIKMQREGVNLAHGAMQEFRKIISGDDMTELYDETIESLVADAERKLGEIDGFMETAAGFIARVDLEKGRFEEAGLRELEEFGQKVDSIISDTSVHSALDLDFMSDPNMQSHGRSSMGSIADLISFDPDKP